MKITLKGGPADGREIEVREPIQCTEFLIPIPLPLRLCVDMKEPEISSEPKVHHYELSTESPFVYVSEDIKKEINNDS